MIFKPGFWLTDSIAISQSEPMLEKSVLKDIHMWFVIG